MGSVYPNPSPDLTPPPPGEGNEGEGAVRELETVLASASFRASPQLSRFLRYTVEHTLRGEGDQLKEYRLGIDVFGRPSSYDPREDPVVRLEARRLRAKLREYYEEEGRGDSLRIDIPKGSYAAAFTSVASAERPDEAASLEIGLAIRQDAASAPLQVVGPIGWSRRAKLGGAVLFSVAILMSGLLIHRWSQPSVPDTNKIEGDQTEALSTKPSGNTEAYLLYLRGRYSWNKRTEEGFNQAIDYFNQAIQKDPKYALAYAGLADSYMLLAEHLVLPANEALPKAEAAAREAIELNGGLSEAHTSLGGVLADQWRWQEAEKEFRRAIELNSRYVTAHQWLAELLAEEGRYDEAIAEIKAAQQIGPLSLIVNAMAGRISLFAGHTDLAIDQLRKTLEVEPNFGLASYDLGKAYIEKGMTAEAIGELQKSINLRDRISERDAALGYAYVKAGKTNEARRVLANFDGQSQRGYVSWYGVAFIYTALGDKDQAFACLEKAYQQHSVRLRDLKVEPLLTSLQSDPRFADLQQRVGLR